MAKETDPKPGTAGGLLAQWDEPVPADVMAACEQAVDAFECENHDYVYDPHNRRHYCKYCDQDPPLDWYDIFSDG